MKYIFLKESLYLVSWSVFLLLLIYLQIVQLCFQDKQMENILVFMSILPGDFFAMNTDFLNVIFH
jgi:uncharacterized membrane protein